MRDELREEIKSFDVQIHEVSHNSKTVELGISWSSFGTVNAEKATEFVSHIQKAIELVNNFKYNAMEII